MNVEQFVEIPKKPFPIVDIGAGGIVKDAHLPAYDRVNFKVKGIYDKIRTKAEAFKEEFDHVEKAYASLSELVEDGKKIQCGI
ncbi:MAG: Gfo/Idh/MocA family oxidoreductase [Flavobacteriaceae bacterium]